MSAFLAAEPRSSYAAQASPLAEADLSYIWEGQAFPPKAMTAADGTLLRVIYRGRRGHGPGPDFRDAIIAAPWGVLEGDVELHLRTSDYERHRHHIDPAYDNVVLHLVLHNDGGRATELGNGRLVPVVALGDWLEARSGEIAGWLRRPAGWEEPCRDSVRRLGAADVGRTLERLGDMRFRAAASSFAKRLATDDSPDDAAWRGLLEALGYGGQRGRFRSLADELPWHRLFPLLTDARASRRRDLALQALTKADAGAAQTTPGVRPANRFERRLEAAAALAARYPSGFVRPAIALLELNVKEAPRALLRGLSVSRVLGRSRAIEIAANVLLPLLAALEGGRYARQAEAVYARLPLPARYGPVRHLHEALPEVPIDARRQQGMLYLLKQYCTQGGCGRCPLS